MSEWQKFGLLPAGVFRRRAGDPRYSSLPRATRFRLALEEKGGLFVLFGQYLAGRADLLTSPYLRQLRQLEVDRKVVDASEVERAAENRISGLVPVRAAPVFDVFRATHGSQSVIVEYLPERRIGHDGAEWRRFRQEIARLEGAREQRVALPRTIEHFAEWLELCGDIERRRTMLRTLDAAPSGCASRFPQLIPGLQSESILAYESRGGEPLWTSDTPEAERGKGLRLLVEGLLEQTLLLSMLDAECRPGLYRRLPDGGLGFLAAPAWLPVPVEWHIELMQYMASTVAGQSPRALRMLARMASGHDPYAGEQRLIRELSGLQPELKVNQVTPPSVTALENFWRAMAQTSMKPPLFLELFHRQWTVAGEWNGEMAPAEDLIEEALWPVMGRVLRLRLGELMTAEKSREWAASSGLIVLTVARQMGMLLEQVRDNDLAMVVEHQESEPLDARLNRRTVSIARSSIALACLLAAAHIGLGAHAGISQVLGMAAAILAAAVLVFFIARIE